MSHTTCLFEMTPSERTYATLVRTQRAVRLLGAMGRTPDFIERPRAEARLRKAVARCQRREAEFQSAMRVCPRPTTR